jgi:hypothetical protein
MAHTMAGGQGRHRSKQYSHCHENLEHALSLLNKTRWPAQKLPALQNMRFCQPDANLTIGLIGEP